MDDPATSSSEIEVPPETNRQDELPLQPCDLRRTLNLTHVRDWCMNRLSHLSLENRLDCARALTAEHLELLETVNQSKTLWMVITRSP
jgi:hypothetical protein